ncbi:unnamed protein product [Didymodactylos carnosus]|uniref:Uncharacterized protein n=1 Tax=Didymodactylos carnosus TaxID=1234261 RepID=A0A814XP26_9BILA|nr:unnamed protein product [Didymodactylos carnosus]CAF1363197.1 unnamed protein product [Didymodactylos carnosus]CAF3981233.1 unnamed protein product [Didymodactylos carnosus]CAF4172904.1 unnamed protein product [Didymodactylos carnosus]
MGFPKTLAFPESPQETTSNDVRLNFDLINDPIVRKTTSVITEKRLNMACAPQYASVFPSAPGAVHVGENLIAQPALLHVRGFWQTGPTS